MERQRAIALHEAAHAVAAWHFYVPFDYIVLKEDNGNVGPLVDILRDGTAPTREELEEIANRFVIHFAGPAEDEYTELNPAELAQHWDEHIQGALRDYRPFLVDNSWDEETLVGEQRTAARAFVHHYRSRIESLADYLESTPDKRLDCQQVFAFLGNRDQ